MSQGLLLVQSISIRLANPNVFVSHVAESPVTDDAELEDLSRPASFFFEGRIPEGRPVFENKNYKLMLLGLSVETTPTSLRHRLLAHLDERDVPPSELDNSHRTTRAKQRADNQRVASYSRLAFSGRRQVYDRHLVKPVSHEL